MMKMMLWCGSLVGVLVFSVMWSELLMPSAISWHQCISAREGSMRLRLRWGTECGMVVLCCMSCCMSVSAVL